MIDKSHIALNKASFRFIVELSGKAWCLRDSDPIGSWSIESTNESFCGQTIRFSASPDLGDFWGIFGHLDTVWQNLSWQTPLIVTSMHPDKSLLQVVLSNIVGVIDEFLAETYSEAIPNLCKPRNQLHCYLHLSFMHFPLWLSVFVFVPVLPSNHTQGGTPCMSWTDSRSKVDLPPPPPKSPHFDGSQQMRVKYRFRSFFTCWHLGFGRFSQSKHIKKYLIYFRYLNNLTFIIMIYSSTHRPCLDKPSVHQVAWWKLKINWRSMKYLIYSFKLVYMSIWSILANLEPAYPNYDWPHYAFWLEPTAIFKIFKNHRVPHFRSPNWLNKHWQHKFLPASPFLLASRAYWKYATTRSISAMETCCLAHSYGG